MNTNMHLLDRYTQSIQNLLVSGKFSELLVKLKQENKENRMFFSRNEHIVLPGLMKSNVEEGEDFKNLLLVCLGKGRVRGDYFYATIAAHFMRPNIKTDKLRYIAEPLTIAVGEIAKHRNWKLDAVLHVLNRRFDNIQLPNVIDNDRLRDGVIKELELDTFGLDLYDMYQDFIEFYSQFVPAVLNPFDASNFCPVSNEEQREARSTECYKILRLHIMRLLGYPLVYLHYQYTKKKYSMGKDGKSTQSRRLTKAAEITQKIVHVLDLVGNSTDYYLNWLRDGDEDLFKEDMNGSSTTTLRYPGQEITIKLNIESLLHYFYLLYCEELGVSQRNTVVSPKFVFETCLNLFNYLLSDLNNYFESIYKTLRLVQVLTDDLWDDKSLSNHRLTTENLKSQRFQIFLSNIIKVTKDFESQEIRKLGKKVLTTVLLAFDGKGRFYLLKQLFSCPETLSTVACLVANLESFIIEGITHKRTQGQFGQHHFISKMCEYFIGNRLKELLEIVLDGLKYKYNLIYHYSYIISILNLLRRLLVTDAKGNLSGLMDYMSEIKESFLKPLSLNLEQVKLYYNNNGNFEEFVNFSKEELLLYGSENQKILSGLDVIKITVGRICVC